MRRYAGLLLMVVLLGWSWEAVRDPGMVVNLAPAPVDLVAGDRITIGSYLVRW